MPMQPKEQQQLKALRCSLTELDARPVTSDSKDSWCYRPTIKNGAPVTEKDWGYIITLPSLSRGRKTMLDGLEGYSILRSKKFCGKFLLQIVPASYCRQYGIDSQMREAYPHAMRAKQRKKQQIWNIRNYSKG